jgi:hypothetical protein
MGKVLQPGNKGLEVETLQQTIARADTLRQGYQRRRIAKAQPVLTTKLISTQ